MPLITHEAGQARGLTIDIHGSTKSGRSHFFLTAPDPILVLNFDFGLDEARDKFPDKYVATADYLLGEHDTLGAYKQMLAKVWSEWVNICDQVKELGGTAVIDTATQLWQLIYTVKLYEVTQKDAKDSDPVHLVKALPFLYADANAKANAFFLLPRKLKINAIYVDRVKPVYDAGGKVISGRFERQGYGDLEALSTVGLRLEFNEQTHARRGIITACRANPNLHGFEVDEPDYYSLLEVIHAANL